MKASLFSAGGVWLEGDCKMLFRRETGQNVMDFRGSTPVGFQLFEMRHSRGMQKMNVVHFIQLQTPGTDLKYNQDQQY